MVMIRISWILLLGCLLLLVGQAFRLQVVQGSDSARRAEQNRFSIKSIPATRGIFYDNTGVPLVTLTPDRQYAYPEAFAHVLGYLGEASRAELVLFGVELGEWVGKQGLERTEDTRLRGLAGGVVEEIAATGEVLRTLSKKEPVPGQSIQLSLSLSLQQKAFELLEKSGYHGAILVSTVDGKLLTLVSYPSFNPNYFSQGADTEIGALFTNESKPLFNRAIAGLYPPASTFKMVTSVAAMEEGVITNKTAIQDTGEVRVGKFRYGNWYFDQYGRTEGSLTMADALKRSNDIYFYKVGERLGIEALARWARAFGFGRKTGIALGGEEAGLVPDKAWKEANRAEAWFLGDTYITAIGQGNLQTTPIQVHQLMLAIANRGKNCRPHLIQSYLTDQIVAGDAPASQYQADCQPLDIADSTLDTVVEGLSRVCEPGGTAWPLFNFKVHRSKFGEKDQIDGVNYIEEASGSAKVIRIPLACKTGTAETGMTRYDEKGKLVHLTHAWITAFAPVVKPAIVVTVLLEEAGQGSDKAAPLAKEMLTIWFERDK